MKVETIDHSMKLPAARTRMTTTTTTISKTIGIGRYATLILVLFCSVMAIGRVGANMVDDGDDGEPQPCTRKMEIQSPILYKLCLYYTHETGIKELDHEDGRWIEDAKNLLLQNSGAIGNGNGGGSDGSLKREELPRVHHMFIRFGRRR